MKRVKVRVARITRGAASHLWRACPAAASASLGEGRRATMVVAAFSRLPPPRRRALPVRVAKWGPHWPLSRQEGRGRRRGHDPANPGL
jgi:hypothetical protein